VNPWQNPRLLNAVANTLFALALLALLGAAAHWFARRHWFDLRAVVIEAAPGHGLSHVNEAKLRATALKSLDGTFFTVDLAVARAAFESVPWVRQVSVRRIWPNRLLVQIEEHRAFATWDDGRLVNTLGELFVANVADLDDDSRLPQLSGPLGSTPEVVKRWRELNTWLEPLEVQPVALTLSPRWAWTARLDNGVTLLLGREQGQAIGQRVAQMVAVWPQVAQRVGATESIDLRYPNGFALRTTLANPFFDKPAGARVRANASLTSSLPAVQTQR